MPRKIGFTVVSSSSHEDGFSPNELLVHTPTVNGWRARRQCSYPQHITVRLEERSRVRKLQLLCHQYMIPSRVELYVGDSVPESSPEALTENMHRLGYVSLCDNEKTSFKARELKSVHVDVIGTYLRLTLHKNHVNRHNRYHQVALVAINVLGDPLDGNFFNTIPSREQLLEHYLTSPQQETGLDRTFTGKCESISPLDDLAFDMYQDPEVAHIIRLLDQRKQLMVHQESFEQAKHLKQAIADLQKVGERLARLEVEKRSAIDKEDYEQAQKKKQQIDEYRASVYRQLELHQLLDFSLITMGTQSSPSRDHPFVLPLVDTDHRSVPTKPPVTGSLKKVKKSNAPQNAQKDLHHAVSVPSKPSAPCTPCTPTTAPKLNVVPYDERPLPVLEERGRPVESTLTPAEEHSPQPDTTDPVLTSHIRGEPEPLSEKTQREAGSALEIFGETIVAAAYSKNWSYREDALMAIHQKLLETCSSGSKEELRAMVRAAVILVKKALLDKVSSVFQAALKLLFHLLSQMVPGGGLGRSDVTHCLEQTWSNLLSRTGESSSRPRLAAVSCIQEIAVLKDVRALQWIPSELVKGLKSNAPCRLAQSRAELVEKLLVALGTEHSGFSVENTMTFCSGALEHSAAPVREVGIRIIFSLYQQHRQAVLNHLPPNDTTTRKNYIYRTLFDGFNKMNREQEDSQNGGDPEQEEIQSVSEQLTDLKELTDREEGTKTHTPKKHTATVESEPQKTVQTAAVSKAQPNKTSQKEDVQQSVTDYLDNLCIFCGRRDEAFTEDGLDLHYWKHCPMLRRCEHCKQVVEISSMTEHLLGECESRSMFSQCPQCTEAVLTEDLNTHIQGAACKPPSPGTAFNHCPLCHNNFLPGEESWKTHLMGPGGCKHNTRTSGLGQRTHPIQGRGAGASRIKQSWTVGARGRPLARGKRIPNLAPPAHRNIPGKR